MDRASSPRFPSEPAAPRGAAARVEGGHGTMAAPVEAGVLVAAADGKAVAPHAASAAAPDDERRGLLLGLLGVAIFALSIPFTRLAGGSVEDPQLPPAFVAMGRAAAAGLLAGVYLLLTGAPRPRGGQWGLLGVTALGVVFGWPLFLGWAVRHVEAVHASVVSGILPLATAVLAALWGRHRPSLRFWLCAVTGCALVVAFAAVQGGAGQGRQGFEPRLRWADGLLLLAVLSGALGYVAGARLAGGMRPQQVISWVLVLSLPLTLPAALATWPTVPVRAGAWWSLGYLAIFSMWLGFFAWYRALAIGGAMRVSQVQLVQPFLSMLFAVPLLGERLDATSVLFALAVIATVFAGKRAPVAAASPSPPARPRAA